MKTGAAREYDMEEAVLIATRAIKEEVALQLLSAYGHLYVCQYLPAAFEDAFDPVSLLHM